MSLRFLLLTACCAVAAIAAPQGNNTKGKPCCSPNSWQAVMTNTSQTNDGVVQYSHYYVDYTQQMDAMAFVSMDPETQLETPLYRLVNDYKKAKTYTIVGDACTSSYNPRSLGSHCVPDNATYLGESYVGFPNVGISYDAWRFKWDFFTLTLALSRDKCVPIIEGVKGTGVDVVYFYNRFETPMNDPSAFQVPSGC